MKRDLQFFTHLILIATGILTVVAFVFLIFLFNPKNNTPKVLDIDNGTSLEKQEENKEYFVSQNLFSNNDFSFSFYYPKDWFVTNNGEYKKDKFINNNNDILSGWVISTFNNPDYQLGKQAALIVKVVKNPNSLFLENWLGKYNKNVLNGARLDEKILSNGAVFYQVADLENQVYLKLSSGEMLILTAPCGKNSSCIGDKEGNQAVFETILSSLSFQAPADK